MRMYDRVLPKLPSAKKTLASGGSVFVRNTYKTDLGNFVMFSLLLGCIRSGYEMEMTRESSPVQNLNFCVNRVVFTKITV